MLFKHSLKKQCYLFPFIFGVLAFLTQIWKPTTLLEPPGGFSFVSLLEMLIMFLVMIPVAFLLNDPYEIELGLVCGVRTTKLFLTKLSVIVLSALSCEYLLIALVRYTPYVPAANSSFRFPIVVPGHYRLFLLVSATVTTMFFIAALAFVRVLTKNSYVTVGFGLFLWFLFKESGDAIASGSASAGSALFDPFISRYFFGNDIPNMLGKPYLWTYNRLLFAGITVLLFVLTYLLLRREKLHEVSGD